MGRLGKTAKGLAGIGVSAEQNFRNKMAEAAQAERGLEKRTFTAKNQLVTATVNGIPYLTKLEITGEATPSDILGTINMALEASKIARDQMAKDLIGEG